MDDEEKTDQERMQRTFDEFNAAVAPHVQRNGWDVGFLLADALTGEHPSLLIETVDGRSAVDLNEKAWAHLAVSETATVERHFTAVDEAGSLPDTGWCVLQLQWPLTRPRLLGALVTSTPTVVASRPVQPGAMAVGDDGDSLPVDTPQGPDRWLLAPGFGYQLSYNGDHHAWLVAEMGGLDDLEFAMLSADE